MLGGGVKNSTVSVRLSVYNVFGRTTGRILMSDCSFDRKYRNRKLLLLLISIFFRKSISIDRYIDFRSINVSIFDNFSSLGMLHIILDQFWALNMNPAIFFRKSISIDRYYRFSIDQCIDFWQIFEFRHVVYHSRSVFGPEHESGNICSKIDIDRSIY